MTIDEAIKNREDCLKYLEGIGQKADLECTEAVRWSVKALKALRPVSREQVEKVWRGEWELYGGDLRSADLRGADLYGARNFKLPIACPDTGSFIGWKKASGYIVKLLIPEDAKRLSATGRKRRCNKAKVLEIQVLDGRQADI